MFVCRCVCVYSPKRIKERKKHRDKYKRQIEASIKHASIIVQLLFVSFFFSVHHIHIFVFFIQWSSSLSPGHSSLNSFALLY